MKLRIYIIIISAFIMQWAEAESFESAIDRIISSSTQYKALSQQSTADIKALLPENNFADPEIEFSRQWGQKGIGTKWGIDLSQTFDWPGLYRARNQQTKARIETIQLTLSAERQKLLYDISSALIDAIYYRELVELYEPIVDNSDSLKQIYERHAANHDVSLLDVDRLSLNGANLHFEQTEARRLYADALDRLSLLGGGEDYRLLVEQVDGFPSTQLPPLAEFIEENLTQSSSLSSKASALNDELLRLKTERIQSSYPSFSIGYMHEYELGEHFNGIKIGLTLPIFSRRNKSISREATRLASEIAYESFSQQMVSQLTATYRQLSTLTDQMKDYEAATTRINETLRLLGIALQSRHITMKQYLDDQKDIIAARQRYLSLARERSMLLTRLTAKL